MTAGDVVLLTILATLTVMLAAATALRWWLTRRARLAARTVVLDAMVAAYARVAEAEARRAFLDQCETVRLNRVVVVPAPRRPTR